MIQMEQVKLFFLIYDFFLLVVEEIILFEVSIVCYGNIDYKRLKELIIIASLDLNNRPHAVVHCFIILFSLFLPGYHVIALIIFVNICGNTKNPYEIQDVNNGLFSFIPCYEENIVS